MMLKYALIKTVYHFFLMSAMTSVNITNNYKLPGYSSTDQQKYHNPFQRNKLCSSVNLGSLEKYKPFFSCRMDTSTLTV